MKKEEKILRNFCTPAGYAKMRLGLDLHPTQRKVLSALFSGTGTRVAFRCGNEIGKTSRVAPTAIFFAMELHDARCVSTARVWRQVTDQLVPNLKKFQHLFPEWKFLDSSISVKGVDDYVGVAATDQARFQGFHADEGKPLLMIVDEAAEVPPDIFLAAEERCNPTWFLVMGSPLDPVGTFYDIETKQSKYYKHFKLTQPECTTDQGYWLSRETIDRKIEKYGLDNPFIQSSVFGEFSVAVEGSLLSLSELESCYDNPPLKVPGQRHAFCDFAAGRDKNVLAVRNGNHVWIEKKWRDSNTMAAVGEFVAAFNKLKREIGLLPEEIDGDADGLGKPMVDRIREMDWNINAFHGGAKARFDDEYKNQVSEMWAESCNRIKRREIIIPRDEEFRAQILGRKTVRNSTGQMQLETKEDMKKRGLESPDEADAILGAIAPPRMLNSFNLMGLRQQRDTFTETYEYAGGERRFFS